jgi:gas vesicle protein
MFRQIASTCVLLGAVTMVSAQTGSLSTVTVQRNTDGRIIQPDKTTSPTITDGQPRPDLSQRALPPEIKDKVRQFETAREAFIRRQELLRKEMQGATTDKERDAIRQRIKDSLDEWREQAKQFREEAIDRMKEVQRELPGLRPALEEGRTIDLKPGGRPGRPGID